MLRRTVCRLLVDGKEVCHPWSMPLPSTMADGKEAYSISGGSWRGGESNLRSDEEGDLHAAATTRRRPTTRVVGNAGQDHPRTLPPRQGPPPQIRSPPPGTERAGPRRHRHRRPRRLAGGHLGWRWGGRRWGVAALGGNPSRLPSRPSGRRGGSFSLCTNRFLIVTTWRRNSTKQNRKEKQTIRTWVNLISLRRKSWMIVGAQLLIM